MTKYWILRLIWLWSCAILIIVTKCYGNVDVNHCLNWQSPSGDVWRMICETGNIGHFNRNRLRKDLCILCQIHLVMKNHMALEVCHLMILKIHWRFCKIWRHSYILEMKEWHMRCQIHVLLIAKITDSKLTLQHMGKLLVNLLRRKWNLEIFK